MWGCEEHAAEREALMCMADGCDLLWVDTFKNETRNRETGETIDTEIRLCEGHADQLSKTPSAVLGGIPVVIADDGTWVQIPSRGGQG
jgi:hypothetical protein